MTALPQHMQALAKAEAQKTAAGDFKRSVRSLPAGAGARKIAVTLEHDHHDDVIGRIRIRRLLLCIKRMGEQNVTRCLLAAGVTNSDRRLTELTPRQRSAVAIQLLMWAGQQSS